MHTVRKKTDDSSDDEDQKNVVRVARTATDIMRNKLDRLNKNFDKPVIIPQPKKVWKPAPPPEFVRNVVGSSAAAGSGEYHIFRNLRKKENARQEYMEKEAKEEAIKKEYEERVEAKRKALEDKACRKRAKRLKKKQRLKGKKQKAQTEEADVGESSGDGSDSDDSSGTEAKDESLNPTNVIQTSPDS